MLGRRGRWAGCRVFVLAPRALLGPPRPEQAAGRSGGSAGLLLHPRCRGASRAARHRRGTAPCCGGVRPCGGAWLSWHRVGSRPELAWVLGAEGVPPRIGGHGGRGGSSLVVWVAGPL